MELAPSDLEDGFLDELLKTRTKECLYRFLDSQRDLFFSQVDQLQDIVVYQCKVTGVNPLSQEMVTVYSIFYSIGIREKNKIQY